MEVYSCEQSVHIDTKQYRKGRSIKSSFASSSSSSSELRIYFNFSCEFRVFEWIGREDYEEPLYLGMSHDIMPMMRKKVRLNKNQFLNKEKARHIIGKNIKHWNVGAHCRELVVKFALDKAQEVVEFMPVSHNVVYLNIRVTSVHKHFYEEGLDWSSACLVPTAESSIEALKKKKITLTLEDSEINCSICLEEFSEGSEGSCMPCSHLFHEDCIKKWLRTSHYCPLCRFEMPTDRFKK